MIGGPYGGYIGMTGNWANLAGCRKIVVWSAANAAQANANYAAHYGVGTGVYWFMGGPGVDPRYNGTQAEASAWGAQQAARTLYDISHLHVTYPVVFMDIEIPGNAPNYTPAPDNGWNTVYTSACSGVVRTYHIPAAVDRADLNGFAAYLTSHSHYKAGVYSAPDIWAAIFGTGSVSRRYRTRTNGPTSPSPAAWPARPAGWCLARHLDVRAVLRRPDQRVEIRADVAVVRRRREPERVRGLRPDRREQDPVTGRVKS